MEQISTSKTEWDLSSLLSTASPEEIEEKRKIWEQKTSAFITKWKNNQDYLTNPEKLKEALDDYEELIASHGPGSDEYYYFYLKRQVNLNNNEIKAGERKAIEFTLKLRNDIRFFELSLAKIPPQDQSKFLAPDSLKEYEHFLHLLFNQAKYLLSDKEEKIMDLKEETARSSWIDMVEGFLSKEERKVLNSKGEEYLASFSEISSLLEEEDKKVRDRAAKAFNEILAKNVDIAEAELNAVLKDKKVNDEIRGFERPEKARHVADDIEGETVDAMITAVSSKFDLSRRFYTLKSKLLGLEKLGYHERNVSVGSFEGDFTYQNSVDIVGRTLEKLDPSFFRIFKQFVEEGYVDVYPRKGKQSGAFCSHMLKSQATHILLNHTNRWRDVETLAHEVGHGINNELIREKQNALYFDTSISTAEVASTFMEDFALEEVSTNLSDEDKLTIIMQKLNGDISSIMRQTACYLFETELHKAFREKGFLSKEEIGKIFLKHMSAYMGDSVEFSFGCENWWVYWSHIREHFYVYSYASGLLISKALQGKVRQNPIYIEKVKEFLSAGLSKSPREIFSSIGLDISSSDFWNHGLQEIEDSLVEAENLARKIGKI